MSGPPWTVTFTITVEDLVAYLRVAQRNLNLIGAAIAIALIASGIVVTAFANDTLTGAVLMIIGVAFYAFGSIDYFERWRVGRLGRNVVGTEATITIDDEGIAAANPDGSGRLAWSSVTEMRENRAVFVIRRDRLNAAWIPKRAFASAGEVAEVQQFIEAHIGKEPKTS